MGSLRQFLAQGFKPHKNTISTIFILLFLGVLLEAVAPWSFKILIDNVLENQPLNPNNSIDALILLFPSKVSLGFFAVFIFFLSNLFSQITQYFQSISIRRLVKDMTYSFSKKVFKNLETISLDIYKNQQLGEYLYRLSNNVLSLGQMLEEGFFPLTASILSTVLITLILFFINLKLALLSMMVLPFLAICLFILNRKVVVMSKKSQFYNSAVFSFLEQTLTHLKIIQAYTKEKEELKAFENRLLTSLEKEHQAEKINFFLSFLLGIVIAFSYSTVIGAGIVLVFQGELSAGLLIVFIFYLVNLTKPILSIISSTTLVKESWIKLKQIEDLHSGKIRRSDEGTIKTISDTTIEFRNVSLSGNHKKTVLDHITLSIPSQKITAIAGMSGSGKTSLISLIPRLIEKPDSGNILIGRKSLEQYLLQTLRESIAFVPQEIALQNTTIKDIIRYGKEKATDDEVKKAAQLAVADEFIATHAKQYDFTIGEDGQNLSVGQRQRLMLARGYIKDAPIVILDDVFSSQDLKTKLEMVSNFRQVVEGKTAIVVSNDLEIIAEADYLIVLQDGKILKTLTHIELVKRNLLREENFNKLINS